MTDNKEIVYLHGQYAVVVVDGTYSVRNVLTGVDEHTTPILYEAIRLCKMFESAVQKSLSQPVDDDSWGKTEESVSPPVQKTIN